MIRKDICKYALNVIITCCMLVTVAVQAQVSYEVQLSHDGKIVYGTFSAPSNSGQYPVVIITPGSGPQDRNGTFTFSDSTTQCLYPGLYNETIQPYKHLAEALVDSGFAVLIYDKLEFTYTLGQLGTITFHKLWLPVESAIDYIKTRTDVDTNCISLIGHSEGSSLIPYIALGRSDIKSLISIAGNRTPFDSILAYQIVNIARICDDDTIAAQFSADQVLEYFNAVRVSHGIGLPPAFGVPARVWYDYFVATEAVSENYNLNDLPTLFIGFGLDINVPLTELERFQNEVTITEDFWSLPDIVHYMTPADDPNVSMVLTDTIVHWLKQQCIPTATHDVYKSDIDMEVFPNPFVNELHISFLEKPSAEVRYTITSITGAVMMVKTVDQNHDDFTHVLNLESVASGVYLLEVDVDGKRVQRLVVKN